MKEVNFRIIELPTHQVLLSKDFDDSADSNPVLVVSFFTNSGKVSQSFAYSTKEKRDKFFDSFSDKQAAKILKAALDLFN